MRSILRSRPVRHWHLTLTIASCLLVVLVACAPQPLAVTREPVSLRLVAAESAAPLADALAVAYEESHPWITVHIEAYNTTLAEGTLRDGDADLALLSWIRQDSGLWSSPIASDGLAVIVHPATPLTDITLGFLQEIYRGRVQEWQGMVFAVVSREDSSGSRASFDAAVLQGRDITLTAVVMPSNQAVVEHVARTPGSIGYVSTLRLSGAAASNVRVLPVNGVLPSPATVDDGSYPLSRTIHLATVGEPVGEGREFAQWALGPEGQSVIEAVRQTP